MNSIALGWEGRQEADHELRTAVYGAAGIKLPPLHPVERPKPTAKDVRSWAAALRAAHAARAKAKTKAPKPGQLKLSPPPDGAKHKGR